MMPTIPPQLSAVLRGDPNDETYRQIAALGPAVQRPMAMASPTPMAPPAPVSPVTPARPAPPPSDDPDLAMPALPQAPDLSNSPVAKLINDYRNTQAQIASVPRPDPNQLKPRLWQRLLGFAAGTAAGFRNPEMGYNVAQGIATRDWSRAQNTYNIQTAPLYRQLETEREALPMAEAQSRIPQQTFENEMQRAREGREQMLDTGRIKQYRARAEDFEAKKDKFIAGTEEEDDNSPTGWTAQTFAGERKPFTPSSATKTPKTPSGEFSGWYEAFQRDNKRAPTAKEINDHEVNLKRSERAGAKDVNPNGWTPDESREIASRGRRYQTRIDSLEKIRGDYVGSKRQSDIDALKGIDDEIEQNHQKIDAIEQDVMGRRGSKGGSPQAAPQGGGQQGGGKKLTDKAKATEYLRRSGWNGVGSPTAEQKGAARKLAAKDGWTF
jgi:hypothetical protein